jgi:hypothetical protein
MPFQLPRAISNHLTLLHQHTPKTNMRSICVDREGLATLGQGQYEHSPIYS